MIKKFKLFKISESVDFKKISFIIIDRNNFGEINNFISTHIGTEKILLSEYVINIVKRKIFNCKNILVSDFSYSITDSPLNTEVMGIYLEAKQIDPSWGGVSRSYNDNVYHINIYPLLDEYFLIENLVQKNKRLHKDSFKLLVDGVDGLEKSIEKMFTLLYSSGNG